MIVDKLAAFKHCLFQAMQEGHLLMQRLEAAGERSRELQALLDQSTWPLHKLATRLSVLSELAHVIAREMTPPTTGAQPDATAPGPGQEAFSPPAMMKRGTPGIN